MAQLSRNKLMKMKSGQTVYRVHGQKQQDGTYFMSVSPQRLCGKKVLHHFKSEFDKNDIQHSSVKFVWAANEKAKWPNRPEHFYRHPTYLSDCMGHATFTKRKQAQRFVDEVLAGLHPQVTESMDSSHAMWEIDRKSYSLYEDDIFAGYGEHEPEDMIPKRSENEVEEMKERLGELGFEPVYSCKFPHVSNWNDTDGIEEEFCLFANREKGLVAKFDTFSYRNEHVPDISIRHVNGGSMYYAFKFNGEADKMPMHLTSSGGFESLVRPGWRHCGIDEEPVEPEDLCWFGDHDLKSPLGHVIEQFEKHGTLLPVWPHKRRFDTFMFVHWGEKHGTDTSLGQFDKYAQLGWQRYKECPQWFQDMTNLPEPKMLVKPTSTEAPNTSFALEG